MEASAGGGGAGPGRRWYFSREQLERSPSRRAGLDPDKELSYRQQAANLLQDMGQRLNVYPAALGRARPRVGVGRSGQSGEGGEPGAGEGRAGSRYGECREQLWGELSLVGIEESAAPGRGDQGWSVGKARAGSRSGESRGRFLVQEIAFRARRKLCRRVGKAWEGLGGTGAWRAVPGCSEGSGRPVPGAPCPFWDRGDFGRGEGSAGMQGREDTARPGGGKAEPVWRSRKSRFTSRESRAAVSGRPGLGVGRAERILGLRKSGWRCGKSCTGVL